MSETAREIRHYFVDEAGDLTFFNKRGQITVGRPGVSLFFMVGVAHVPDPVAAGRALSDLRAELLADPYFNNVPSMQIDAGKTAKCFHAKDDLPEVRREVFKLLPKLGAKVQVAVRRKVQLAEAARLMFRASGRRMPEHDIYDDLVKRLFKNLLHKADLNRIVFARRGKSPRQDALERAIQRAQRNFESSSGISAERPTALRSNYPSESAGLQVVDYYLWALQRFYERGEDRFFRLLAGDYRLIMDLDDKRNRPYGEWYSDHNPLELNKIASAAD